MEGAGAGEGTGQKSQGVLEHEAVDLVGEGGTEAFADGNEQSRLEDRVWLKAFEAK